MLGELLAERSIQINQLLYYCEKPENNSKKLLIWVKILQSVQLMKSMPWGALYGATLEILSVTPDLSNLFSYFNYSLEVSENITPLWPPLYSVDGVLCSNKKKVYLLSSFTLVPHSNISCENDKLELFDDVFELDITLPVRISRNNVNMQIEQRKNQHLQLVNSCEQVTATKKGNRVGSFLFDRF